MGALNALSTGWQWPDTAVAARLLTAAEILRKKPWRHLVCTRFSNASQIGQKQIHKLIHWRNPATTANSGRAVPQSILKRCAHRALARICDWHLDVERPCLEEHPHIGIGSLDVKLPESMPQDWEPRFPNIHENSMLFDRITFLVEE